MKPEELTRLEDLEKLTEQLLNVTNVQFIENLKRRLPLKTHKLSDHSDVENTDSASTNQVLKKTATTWQPGTDNT
jgi:hypothetical protein